MKKWLLPFLSMALAAVLLYALAWQLTRQGIDRQARSKAAIYEAGGTPWDFAPRAVEDLIAGRAFGAVDISHDQRGLIARSRNTAPYELGVPLPYPVDLKYFPVLQLGLDNEGPVRLQWLVRERLAGPMLVSEPIRMKPGSHDMRMDLQALRWYWADTGDTIPLPRAVAMLRLKLRQPPNTIVRLRWLRWRDVSKDGARLATHPLPWSTLRRHSLSAISDIPVLLLPGTGVEAMLAQRDAIAQAQPAAVVVASVDALRYWSRPAGDAMQTIAALLAYALIMLLTWKRTRQAQDRPRLRGLLSLLQAGVCAGPLLAWAIGMYGDPDPGAAWLSTMLAALGFTLWLAWRSYARNWRWLAWQGHMDWRDWILPSATVLLAFILLLASGSAPQRPGIGKALVYLAWAAMQQLLILAVLAPRLHALFKPRWLCALVLGTLFALAHAPNALLMQLTLLAEMVWAWHFLKRPVLLPVVLAHALAGLLLAAAISGLPLRSLEVGARFLQ
ncbi:MAG: CPBP family glutamic-type intramembrane protease [Rhodanobacteraceae bacterium]